ncbi:hypothetical protein DSL72_000502 [Monilinia vaccinii-corymbosi]|uniref:Uncharacterized protein n=1 Tax=Monilinia vaccinii-corymbosi TaxID=61207 RepID=A0A8A3NZH7_9HELO|nr:hypothetical protein DSL72_000502 [Monilinia vaccinii-corymbosi]
MAKNLARSKSVMSRLRGRDATTPSSTSLHVTDDAQGKAVDPSTVSKIEARCEDRRRFPERPSTSGAPKKAMGTFPRRANTTKRERGEDLFFNPLTAHGKDGPSFYDFPSPAVPQVVEPRARPRSPDPIDASRRAYKNASEPEIGTALKSPACPQEHWQAGVILSPLSLDDMSARDASVVSPKQKKGRKWFGLFGSKKVKAADSFYQLEPAPQPDVPPTDSSSSTSEAKRTGRSREPVFQRDIPLDDSSLSTSKAKRIGRVFEPGFQPDIPWNDTFSSSTSIRAGTLDVRVQDPIGVEALQSYPKVSPEGRILDLKIPSVHMERYSVMFGEILPKPSTTTSALLQRRQATLDSLESAEEAFTAEGAELEARAEALEKHGAASPQLHTASTWSPNALQLLSPPATEDSEADARSTKGQDKQERGREAEARKTPTSNQSPHQDQETRIQVSNLTSRRQLSPPTPASPYPPRSTSIGVPQPPEPPYTTHHKQGSTCSITSSLLNDDDEQLDPPRTADSRDAEQKRLEAAASVSIARQVSLSRSQRQLLIPIKISGSISKRHARDPKRSSSSSSPPRERSELTDTNRVRKIVTYGDDNVTTGGESDWQLQQSVAKLGPRGVARDGLGRLRSGSSTPTLVLMEVQMEMD